MDEVETQGCDLAKLDDARARRACRSIGRRFADFLESAARRMAEILVAERRDQSRRPAQPSLDALAKRLASTSAGGMVIAAGSTGSIPATANCCGVIARLPNGMVVLPGLDRELDEESWNDLDPGHPQFGMKQLLEPHRRGAHGCARLERRAPLRRANCCCARLCGRHRPPMRGARSPNVAAATSRAGSTVCRWSKPPIRPRKRGHRARPARGTGDAETDSRARHAGPRAGAARRRRTGALGHRHRRFRRPAARPTRRRARSSACSPKRPIAASRRCRLLALLKHPLARWATRARFRAKARALDMAAARPASRCGARRHRPRHCRRRAGRAARHWFAGLAEVLRPLGRCVAPTRNPHRRCRSRSTSSSRKTFRSRDALWRGEAGENAARSGRGTRRGRRGLAARRSQCLCAAVPRASLPKAGPARFRQASAPCDPWAAGSAAAELRPRRPGRIERRHWPQAAAPIPGSRGRCARRSASNSRNAPSACPRTTSRCWPRHRASCSPARTKAEGAPTVASRWVQRLTQLTNGLGLEGCAGAEDATIVALSRALDDPGRRSASRCPRRRRRSTRGRHGCPSPRSRPGCAIPMRSMPSASCACARSIRSTPRSVRWNAAARCIRRWSVSSTSIPASCRTMRGLRLIAIADEVFAAEAHAEGGAGAVAAALPARCGMVRRRGARAARGHRDPRIPRSGGAVRRSRRRLRARRHRRPHRRAGERRRGDPRLQDRQAADAQADQGVPRAATCCSKRRCWRAAVSRAWRQLATQRTALCPVQRRPRAGRQSETSMSR